MFASTITLFAFVFAWKEWLKKCVYLLTSSPTFSHDNVTNDNIKFTLFSISLFSYFRLWHSVIINWKHVWCCGIFRYGEIVDVNLVRDKSTGKSKGFAFLAYEDQRSTILAVGELLCMYFLLVHSIPCYFLY